MEKSLKKIANSQLDIHKPMASSVIFRLINAVMGVNYHASHDCMFLSFLLACSVDVVCLITLCKR